MHYKELSAKMASSGWLSHQVAACNTDHRHGSGQKHFRAKLLSDTRTGQAFLNSQPVPSFDSEHAVSATLRFHDEHGWHDEPISVDVAAGLIARFHPDRHLLLVGFLSDIPRDRITFDAGFPPRSTPSQQPPDYFEPDDSSTAEGAAFVRQHLIRERDRSIIIAKRRQVLLSSGRLACAACAFDFERFYGEIGAEFCEVHHLYPIGDADGEVETRLDDLAVVCANCHRMLHRTRPLLTLEELKSRIRNA